MKIKTESIGMNRMPGGLLGWCALHNAGFDRAYYVWDADTAGEDPQNADNVLTGKGYLSIKTKSTDTEYITAIAKHLLGEPEDYRITFSDGIVKVRQGREEVESEKLKVESELKNEC